MSIRSLLIILCFFLYHTQIKGEVFKVISNANNGSGTLRQALELAAANGTTETDYIHFDIANGPSVIIIDSPLLLSSDLVVDGTSSPGNFLGVSNAKIILETSVSYTSNSTAIGFSGANLKNIEIYGFYFPFFANASSRSASPLFLNNCENIIIGAPTKGNVFGMVDVSIYMFKCKKIKVSTNLFGVNPERTQLKGTAFGSMLRFYLCDEIMFGGNSKAEGNQCGYTYAGMQISGINPATQNKENMGEICRIKNNIFGDEQLKGGLSTSHNIRNFKKIEILDNFISMSGGFNLTDISESGIIQGNSFGVSSISPDASYTHSTLGLESCNNIIIGGKGPNQSNVIANSKYGGPGVYAINCGDITILRNSIYCISQGTVYKPENSKVELPVIVITNYTNGKLTGIATPNSEIEVYTDGECLQCEAKTYVGTTYADDAGNWSMTIPAGTGFTASATLNNRTSKFLGLSFLAANVKVKPTSCGLNNGSITGLMVEGATLIEWRDSQNNLIGNTADIKNLKPGVYTFRAFLGATCKTQTLTYQVNDGKPNLSEGIINITPATCNQENGSIKSIYFPNYADFTIKELMWLNEKHEVKGSSHNLLNVKGGKYTLKVITTDDCTVLFGPYIIPTVGVPSIDQTKAVIVEPDCGQANGSIGNIIASGQGNISFLWKSEQNKIIGTEQEIKTIAGGKYFLEIKDSGTCGTAIYEFNIPEKNGIIINETHLLISNSSCKADDGSIKNLEIISASANLTYKWFDEGGSIISTSLNIEDLKAGKYTLVVDNGYCTVNKSYIIIKESSTAYPDFAFTSTPASCNLNNGEIKLHINGSVFNIKFRWVDATGYNIGNSDVLSNVKEGEYDLYLTDNNNCERFYKRFSVARIPPLSISLENLDIVSDRCEMGVGAISDIQVNGGTAPYQFEWRDSNQNILANTIHLSNVKYGNYSLRVKDNSPGNCNEQSVNVFVPNKGVTLAPPKVQTVNLCAEGEVTLRASSDMPGRFTLYNQPLDGTPIGESENGIFKTTIHKDSKFFISFSNGNCVSDRVNVPIIFSEVGIEIPNTFSPNSDGINDTWIVKYIEQYPMARVKVFNRNGILVYSSVGYKTSFDGKRIGSELPVGIYFYTIELAPNCKVISGSLTILR